jgi:hypothetical protein
VTKHYREVTIGGYESAQRLPTKPVQRPCPTKAYGSVRYHYVSWNCNTAHLYSNDSSIRPLKVSPSSDPGRSHHRSAKLSPSHRMTSGLPLRAISPDRRRPREVGLPREVTQRLAPNTNFITYKKETICRLREINSK